MADIATGVFVALNGIKLGCVLKSVNVSGKGDSLESTALCSTARTFKKGLIEKNISGEGFFQSSEFTVADVNGLLQSAVTSVNGDFLFLLGRDGTTVGAVADMYNLKVAKYDVKNVVAELNMAVFEGQVTETATAEFHKIGVMLFVNDGVTETPVDGTSYDSTSGGTGYVIQIHVLDGADAANVTIQHSANNSTWADLIAAADYDEYTATQLKSTVTSVNRYVRAVVAATDTANSVAIAMKVGY